MSAAKIPIYLYYSYALLVAVKRGLGLSRKPHRSFYLMKVMRALNRGCITGRLDITAAGKSDGVGAQAIARISALCFAKAYGLNYVHTPFQTLAHAELPMPEWVASWEQLLRLGDGALQASDSELPIVDLETYATTPTLWKTDCLLATRHYHTFCRFARPHVEQIASHLRRRFESNSSMGHFDPIAPLVICLHIRRGDVRPGDADTGHRFMENKRILSLIEEIRFAVIGTGRTCSMRLYSQGTSEEFAEFTHIPDLELRLGSSALDAFREFVEADILLMAQSDFSYTAGMFSSGIKICDPRHRVPLAGWVQIDPRSGRLDAKRLQELILAKNTDSLSGDS